MKRHLTLADRGNILVRDGYGKEGDDTEHPGGDANSQLLYVACAILDAIHGIGKSLWQEERRRMARSVQENVAQAIAEMEAEIGAPMSDDLLFWVRRDVEAAACRSAMLWCDASACHSSGPPKGSQLRKSWDAWKRAGAKARRKQKGAT